MNKIYINAITDRENSLLPFLNMKIKEDPLMSMDLTIRKSKNIINDETFKLVDEFKILKFKKNLKNVLLKPNKSYKVNLVNHRIQKIQLNNNIKTSANNEFFKDKIRNMKTMSYKTNKYKKIKNFKLSSTKDKYLSLLKKYNYNDIKRKQKILDVSKTSNNNSVTNKPNKSSSNMKINETQIKNSNSVINTLNAKKSKIPKKFFNKSFSKFFSIEKALYDTQKSSINIIKRINRYKALSQRENQNMTDNLQKREESLKKIEDLIDEENSKKNRISKINYQKILGPLNKSNDLNLKKIKINPKATGQIWVKQSTANLLKFGQYFNKMDDAQFFKQRKKIINKFESIEKDSNIIDGIKTERNNKYDFGQGIKKNNKIIKQLAEDGFDFFQNISKKLDNM